MKQLQFSLESKKKLTHNVFELTFSCAEPIEIRAGQYIMFQLDSGLKRSYSIAHSDGDLFNFIIKRLDHGGGSAEMCDLPMGATVKGLWPLGHFVLQNTPHNKLFIGTGTGFAPLYFQIKQALADGMDAAMRFVFGVKTSDDVFYTDILSRFQSEHDNFNYTIYLSQEKTSVHEFGRVTNFLTQENVAGYEEFYICWSPPMVKEVRERLASFGISKERVYFEQF